VIQRTAFDAALLYRDARLSVIPVRSDGTKAPAVPSWKQYQTRIASQPELSEMMNHGRQVGVAVICGAVSGNLEVIDFDQPGLFEQFVAVAEAEAPGLIGRLTVIRTPSGGNHVAYRCDVIEGNQKLAQRPAFDESTGKIKAETLIETRGEGGYIVAPGSPAECHVSMRCYDHVFGPPLEEVATVTTDERNMLLAVARSFNEFFEPDAVIGETKPDGCKNGPTPGDDFALRTTWEEILEPHGWTKLHISGNRTYWRRPGKSEGWSATTGNTSQNGSSLLCVFTTSTEFEIPVGRSCGAYGKFGAYAVLNHGRDFSAAAKALAKAGYGAPKQSSGGDQPIAPEQIDIDLAATTIAENKIINAVRVKDSNSTETFPLTMEQIIEGANKLTGGWPRRVGSALFVDDIEHGIGWLESTGALFGYFQRRTGICRWCASVGCVKKEELFAELRRSAQRYLAIEQFPHEPKLDNHYYACRDYEPGDGKALDALLERFSPETTIDGDLLKAAIATPFWGGAGGMRPAFVITADKGRGVGKSTAAMMMARVAGGYIEIHANEDSTKMRERLLSSEGLTRRFALLDNVKSLRFSWADLESLITGKVISGRKMYVGEASRPNSLSWFITLNGASLCTDLAQRSVIIKLARPIHSDNWEQDTAQFIDDNHDKLIADIIGFLRSERNELSRFSRWGAWEHDVLSRLPEPREAQKVILERQGAADVEQEESELIEEYFAGQLVGLGYSPAEDRIHIPVAVAAKWFGSATNSQHSVTGASRTLSQMTTEGKSKRLLVNPSRTHGRGFLWVGQQADMGTSLWTDFNERVAEKARRERQEVRR